MTLNKEIQNHKLTKFNVIIYFIHHYSQVALVTDTKQMIRIAAWQSGSQRNNQFVAASWFPLTFRTPSSMPFIINDNYCAAKRLLHPRYRTAMPRTGLSFSVCYRAYHIHINSYTNNNAIAITRCHRMWGFRWDLVKSRSREIGSLNYRDAWNLSGD